MVPRNLLCARPARWFRINFNLNQVDMCSVMLISTKGRLDVDICCVLQPGEHSQCLRQKENSAGTNSCPATPKPPANSTLTLSVGAPRKCLAEMAPRTPPST